MKKQDYEREKKKGLERMFDTLWRQLGGRSLKLQKEYRFHPTRRWRFDRAHPDTMIAIEIMGGTWSGGAHVRGSGYRRDCEKLNAATLEGWRVFYLTAGMLKDDPAGNLIPIIQLIKEDMS